MQARKQTISWSSWDPQEAGDVAKQPRESDREESESERRRKKTVDDMQALVGEAEDVEARVRTRSRRMKGPSASPDLPSDGARKQTLGPPSRERSADSPPSSSRKGDSGRYSFVYPASKSKKKP